jgi:hypothetical protein
MTSDERLHRILRFLVFRSFPRLRGRSITVAWGSQYELLYSMVSGDGFSVCVNDRLRAAPDRVLEGGLDHKLCHIDAEVKLGPFQRELAWSRYERSQWCRMREERAVERCAVRLGYAVHLLALDRFAHQLGYRFTREDGLLMSELCRLIGEERKLVPTYEPIENVRPRCRPSTHLHPVVRDQLVQR